MGRHQPVGGSGGWLSRSDADLAEVKAQAGAGTASAYFPGNSWVARLAWSAQLVLAPNMGLFAAWPWLT